MFCSQCGNSITGSAKFCNKCGTSVEQAPTSPINSPTLASASVASAVVDITKLDKAFIESQIFNKLIKSNVDYYRSTFLKVSPYLNLSTAELQSMGANDQIKKLANFNWAAGLFGPLWLAYRKVYGPALLITFIEFSISRLATKLNGGNDFFPIVMMLVLSLILIGFFGNNMYYINLVKKLKTAKSELDLEDIGGTSVPMVFAFLGLSFLLEIIGLTIFGK